MDGSSLQRDNSTRAGGVSDRMRRAGNVKRGHKKKRNKKHDWTFFKRQKRNLESEMKTRGTDWKAIQGAAGEGEAEMIKQGEKKGWEADPRTAQWQMGVFWSVTNVPRKNGSPGRG